MWIWRCVANNPPDGLLLSSSVDSKHQAVGLSPLLFGGKSLMMVPFVALEASREMCRKRRGGAAQSNEHHSGCARRAQFGRECIAPTAIRAGCLLWLSMRHFRRESPAAAHVPGFQQPGKRRGNLSWLYRKNAFSPPPHPYRIRGCHSDHDQGVNVKYVSDTCQNYEWIPADSRTKRHDLGLLNQSFQTK